MLKGLILLGLEAYPQAEMLTEKAGFIRGATSRLGFVRL